MATLLRFLSLGVLVYHSLNLCTDFYQIFRGCLPQEDLDLIRFWGYPVATIAMATLLKFSGLKVSSKKVSVT